MSLFVWPTNPTKIPPPDISFNNDIENPVIRTKMDSGKVRQRARFTSAVRLFTANWTLTDAQYALFQGILKYKLSNGADWFEMQLMFGNGFDTYEVRFIDGKIKSAYKVHLHWRVSAAMETENTSPLSEAETDAALA